MKKQLLLLVMMLLPVLAMADEPIEINGIYYNLISKAQQAEVTRKPNSDGSMGKESEKYTGDIVIPESVEYEGVTYTVSSIGKSAFVNSSVTSVTIPNSVTSIGDMAFDQCHSLKSISIPGCVKTIGYRCYGDCREATSILIEDGLESIGEDAFIGCGFADLVIPNSVTSIGIGAFVNCPNLTNVTLPDNIEIINVTMFYDCRKLASVNIPDGVSSIYHDAFGNCESLSSITLPNSVNRIGQNAFKGCSGLKTITIGDNMTQIENNAFAGCKNMEVFYNYTEVVPSTNSSAFQDSYVEYSTLYVPYGTKKDYEVSEPWKDFGTIIEMPAITYDLTYLVNGEVYKSYTLKKGELITPEPEPTKEGYTFSGWSEIPETMPNHDVTVTGTFTINKYRLIYLVDGEEYKVYEIEYGAAITPEAEPTKEESVFSGWSEIPETMPAHDVTVTGTFTVNKYKLIYMVDDEVYQTYDVEYGATITTEPDPIKEGYAFSGWSEIPETMPNHDVTVTGTFTINKYKLTYLVDDEEYKVYELEYGSEITPEAEPTKEGYTFSGWSEIPETMPAYDVIVTGTFSLTNPVIDDISYEATDDGLVLTNGGNSSGSVVIPATIEFNGQTYQVTEIGEGAFKGNTAITSVSIDNGIIKIGASAFEGCSNLTEIVLGSDIVSIGEKAFANFASSSSVPRRADEYGLTVYCYPKSVPETATNAFENTPIDKALLLVYDEVINDYANAAPWNKFGTIQGFNGGTGIKSIWAGEGDNAKIYDLKGRRVVQPSKGLYIKNGKKYVVK